VSDEALLARLVMYEVAESLRFEQRPSASGDGGWRRLANATLLGKEVHPLREGTPFVADMFTLVTASSSVDMTTWRGWVRGTVRLLNDTDPRRPSLDRLVEAAVGGLRGRIDLRHAPDGWATVAGRWRVGAGEIGGRFEGVFTIPFVREGEDGYWYREGPALDGVCRLRDDEFALGIPLIKLVLQLFA
jgi:hypothetical protein